ncbi:hypothetical protein ACIBTV_02305 [Micromonospora sp. NPDC049366]|uniref:hypothetical protein n=1 Tax=Micromonospora sp. NPDC049366 TaxID=3364271 RepID=UPI00378F183A
METAAPAPAPVTPRPQRHRAWWLVASAVALVGVLALGAAGLTVWRISATRTPATAAAPVTVPEPLAGLPDRLQPPANPTALPSGRAVGRGALLYRIDNPDDFDAATGSFAPQPMYLVTASGEQFGVGLAARVGELSQALSPDGRWFAHRRDGQWWIRDLTGTAELAVPVGYELRLWSTDGRAVLLGQRSGSGEAYAAFSLPGGQLRTLALRGMGNRRHVAFLDGRELATTEFTNAPNPRPYRQLTVAIQDVDGRTARSVSVATTQEVGPGDLRNAPVPLVRGGGDPPTMWAMVVGTEVPAGKPAGTEPPVTLVGVDLRSGRPVGRLELAVPQDRESEEFLGLAGTAILLQSHTTNGSQLVAADPATGQRRVLTTLPDPARVFIPGE